jgi:hypothetical protein
MNKSIIRIVLGQEVGSGANAMNQYGFVINRKLADFLVRWYIFYC